MGNDAGTARPAIPVDQFLIARGGPFYEVQRRLGLLHERAMRAPLRAAILVGLAWGVPLVLSALEGRALGPLAEAPYLLSLGAMARFGLAIAIFVLMERLVEERLKTHLGQFVRAPLLAPSAIPAAADAVVRALGRLNSRIAELVCLILAALITASPVTMSAGVKASSWLLTVTPEGDQLTLAGWWAVVVSNPLFWFLLLRWLWRQVVWSLLLREFARLELRLVASHPDGAGGLAFLGQYPNAFAAFVFAVSSVLGAALAHALLADELTPTVYGYVMGAWLVIVMGLFALPLFAFRTPLRRLKEATVLHASAVATRHERAVERKILGRNLAAAADASDATAGDVPDAAKLFAAGRKLSTQLFSRAALVPVGTAALLPLVAAGATRIPFADILKIAKRLLLL